MKNIRKQLIFVDDSGDPGFKHNSSNNFVMAAVFFVEAEASDSIMCEMNKYRQELVGNIITNLSLQKIRKIL